MTESSGLTGAGVDARTFRHVVGHLTSGVTVITTEHGSERFGMTVSSVTSLSAEPALMLACLNNSVPTADAVSRSGHYAVNVLGQGHGDLAQKFAMPSRDKFAGVDVVAGVVGAPLIANALAHIECEVVERVVGGTHTIFIGRVVSATAYGGEPLTYFRGGFGRFEFARDDAVYTHARQRVLNRVHQPGDVVDVEELAVELGVEPSAAFYALTRLTGDGLVRRDPDRGYVVTAFDASASDATFDARLAIEIGVIEQVIGQAAKEDLIALRQAFDVMAGLLVGDRFVDFDAYLDANYAFHARLVGLARNPVLDATFGTLSIKQVMTRSFGSTPVTSQRFIEAQRGITEGIETGDRARALAAASEYTRLAKERVREILQQTGGQI